VKLVKALYGEKQAPKLWSDLLDKILYKMGFVRCPVCPCLYLKTVVDENGQVVFSILITHVDDGYLGSNKDGEFERFLVELNSHLTKVTGGSPVQKYIGVKTVLNAATRHFECSMESYIDKLPISYGRTEYVPMTPTVNLRTAENNPENKPLLDITGLMRFFADRVRWDLLTVTGELSSHGGATAPSNEHVKTAAKAIDYARTTRG